MAAQPHRVYMGNAFWFFYLIWHEKWPQIDFNAECDAHIINDRCETFHNCPTKDSRRGRTHERTRTTQKYFVEANVDFVFVGNAIDTRNQMKCTRCSMSPLDANASNSWLINFYLKSLSSIRNISASISFRSVARWATNSVELHCATVIFGRSLAQQLLPEFFFLIYSALSSRYRIRDAPFLLLHFLLCLLRQRIKKRQLPEFLPFRFYGSNKKNTILVATECTWYALQHEETTFGSALGT